MGIPINKKPSSITYNITERCQSKCSTCNLWQTPSFMKEKEMTTSEWKKFLFLMHSWLGNYSFILSGGEPFIRDDAFEIINYAAELGENINIITNGLYSVEKIFQFLNCGASGIIVSLNALDNPSIHNISRGRDDAFYKTINFLQNLVYQNKVYNKGKNIYISTVVMPSNLTELKSIAEYCKIEGLEVRYQLMDNGDAFKTFTGKDNQLYSVNIKKEAINAIDEIIELKKHKYPIGNSFEQLNAFKILINNPDEITNIKCIVGENNLAVDPYGNCNICFCMESIGNIKNNSIENLWYSYKAEEIRSQIEKCTKNCRLLNCNYK